MAHEEPTTPRGPAKLVIQNIGLMLSGDIGNPILDADAIVAIDGRIAQIGRIKDIDAEGATTVIDAHGVALSPGRVRIRRAGSIPLCTAASPPWFRLARFTRQGVPATSSA
jgi:hypothetical protein